MDALFTISDMDLGQVFTNRNIARFMASLFTLDANATMLDPCFGTGVFLEALDSLGFKNVTGYEIDSTLYDEVLSKFKKCKLYNEDFLSSQLNHFDGIIMNPPYIRQEKIDGLSPLGVTKNKLRNNIIFSELPQNANLYMYFILKAITILREGGELIVIFPNTWLKARNGVKFRELIGAECSILQQINITGKVFEKNALVDVLILKIKKEKICAEPIIQNLFFDGQKLVKKKLIHEMDLGFNLPFFKVATAKRGLTTGCNAIFINPALTCNEPSCLTPIITSPKSIKGFSTKDVKLDYLLTLNQDVPNSILEYLNSWEEKIINTQSPKTLYNKILDKKAWYRLRLIQNEGIIFSYFIRNEIRFIYNNSSYQVRDNFYIVKPKISGLLLFALLNNYYTFYQLECYGKRYGAGLLKIQRYDLERINFPDISCFDDNAIYQLENLSMQLIATNDLEIVNSITQLISQYSLIGYKDILEQYSALKKERLEDKNYD
jgi:hypothetical protein